MEYNVTFARFGHATINANSPDEALEKAQMLGKDEVEWSDDFVATDADEPEED